MGRINGADPNAGLNLDLDSTTCRWQRWSAPGVTVMAQDPGAVGRLAAQRLFERMDGDHSPPYLRVVPTRLVVRGSGELPVPGSVATPA